MAKQMDKITVRGHVLYVTATGVKETHRSPVLPIEDISTTMARGMRRQFRKALRKIGRVDLVQKTL